MPASDENEDVRPDPARLLHEEVTVVPGIGSSARNLEAGAGAATDPLAVSNLREFSSALIEIGLVDQSELESYAVDSAEGVLGLSRALVRAGKLTAYQAAAIYQKKSRGLLIGNYVILDKLGQGGMGVVFKARHRRLGRVGALKILPPSFARDHQAVMRFRREVEAAGRLKHPNVVAALDADEDRGVHFLVMEYVEGRDLDRVVRERGPMKTVQAIDCVIQAARGLEAAHAQGIVHRDIKPGNLMLDAPGTVRVLDLGLARLVDAANPFGKSAGARLTESGMYMGTIDFMAPEQAEDSHRVDHRADIYSLGCTLYFLLNAREPFEGATVLKRLMAHMERPAPSLREKRPEVPASLESVYQRMMAKKPADRPSSMTELISLLEACKADAKAISPSGEAPKSKPDLLVFNETPLKRPSAPKSDRDPSLFPRPMEAEGLAISHDFNLEDLIMDVRSQPPAERTQAPTMPMAGRSQPLKRSGQLARVRRTPRNAALIAAVASVATLIAGATWIAVTHRGEGKQEVKDDDASVRVDSPDQGSKLTDRLADGSNDAPPTPFHDEFQTIFDGSSAAGWILNKNKAPLPRSHVQKDGLNPHNTGSYLVVYQEKLSDFELEFDYKLAKGCNTGVFLRVSDLADPVHTGIEVAIDDTTGHGLGDSGAFFDLVAPETNAQYPAGQVNHMKITAQGAEISVVINGSRVSTIHLDEWTVPGKRPDGSDHHFKDVAVADLARIGYIGFQDLKENCWFSNIRLRKLSPGGVSSAGTVVAGDTQPSKTLPAPAVEPYVETARFIGHAEWVQSLYLLPDRRRLLSTSHDKTARLWDVASGREIQRFWHPDVVLTAAVLPDGRRCITGCTDGVVRLWDMQSGKLIRPLVRHGGTVRALALASDGTRAYSGGDDRTLRMLDVEKGGELRQFEGVSARIESLAVSPDGRRVIAGADNGVVYLGNTTTSDPVQPLTGHSDSVLTIAFAPDGRDAISGGGDGRLIYWDVGQKRAMRQTRVSGVHIACIAFATDGHHVNFGGHRGADIAQSTGVLGRWDVTADGPTQQLGAGAPHTGLALLPREAVATADRDGVMRIWEASKALAIARQLAQTGERNEALAEYDKAVASRVTDPHLLIERGRFLAAVGQADKAAVDFKSAANLAPESPQFFLDAPWWVAGPYPVDYNKAGPLESGTATDPSKPAPPVGNTTLRWHEVSPGKQGHVNIEELFKSDDAVAYAMTVIYSASPREAALLIGADDTARIWLNGREVFVSKSYSSPDSGAILVTLTPGRNTLVARVRDYAQSHGFSIRFADSPADLAFAYAHAGKWREAAEYHARAMALDPDNCDQGSLERWAALVAQAERWKEAKEAFEKIASLHPGDFGKQQALLHCYLALADHSGFERVCKTAVERHANTQDRELANNVMWNVALMPNAVRNYTTVVDIGAKLLSKGKPTADEFNTYGALLYRAGNYRTSLTYLNRSNDSRKGDAIPWDWIFIAMVRHKTGQPGAREAISKAKAIAEKSPPTWWQHRVELKVLFQEADELLKSPATR